MESVTGAAATSPADTLLGQGRITEAVSPHSHPTRVVDDTVALSALAKQAATRLALRQELVLAGGLVRGAPLANLGQLI
jgi:hypothetical protein